MNHVKWIEALILAFICLYLPRPAQAMVFNPSEEQIREAVERGKKLANVERETEDKLGENLREFMEAYEFGPGGSCNGGRVSTKLETITFLSFDRSTKYKEVEPELIDEIKNMDDFAVTVTTCYSSIKYVKQDHLVIKAGSKIIQPSSITQIVDSSRQIYLNRISATFPYATFKDLSQMTVIVVPPIDEELHFDIDLATMP